MRRAQIYLEEQLWNRLHFLAEQSGTSVSELVRQAVREKYPQISVDRRKALGAARGVWADRADLPHTETYVRALREGRRKVRKHQPIDVITSYT